MTQKFVPANHPLPPMQDHNGEKTAVVRIVIKSYERKSEQALFVAHGSP